MDELKEALEQRLALGSSISEDGEVLYVSIPLLDRAGDFVKVRVRNTGGGVAVDDDGAIAGLLFDLDDDGAKGARAFRFIERAATVYGLTVNTKEGLIQMDATSDPPTAAAGVLYFAKIVLTLDANVADILTGPSSGGIGRRVVAQITRELRERHLLEHLNRHQVVPGAANPEWKADYAYKRDGEEVLIVGADLGVRNPLRKAAHVIAMAMDVRSPTHDLRVAYSTQGQNGPSAYAARLIHTQGQEYRIFTSFDLNDRQQWLSFYDALDRDLGDRPSEDRTIW